MTLRPGIPRKREKGQPEGSAVTGKTRKPRVAEMDLVFNDAAGQRKGRIARPVGTGRHWRSSGVLTLPKFVA
jgi:hypothetical protein